MIGCSTDIFLSTVIEVSFPLSFGSDADIGVGGQMMRWCCIGLFCYPIGHSNALLLFVVIKVSLPLSFGSARFWC